MDAGAAHTWYDYIRDFSGPVMYLVQNIILAVTAVYALKAIRENRKNTSDQIENQERVAKKRATLDLILNMAADLKYNEARVIILKMRNENIDPARLTAEMRDVRLPEDDRKHAAERYRACQYLLGRFELFASGIKTNALDEEAFKAHYYSSYIVYVDYLRGYIEDVRKTAAAQMSGKTQVSADTIYQEVISLFEVWKRQPLAKSHDAKALQ